MHRRHTRAMVIGLLVGVALAAFGVNTARPVLADDDAAVALVESVYGDRIKQVAASRDNTDDLELAGEMYRIAQSTNDGPAVVVALCDRIYQIASRHGDGLGVSVDAMRLAIKHDPARRGAYLDRAIALQQRAYTAARAADRTPVGLALIDLLVEAGDDRRDAGAWADAAVFYRRAMAVAGVVHAPNADAIRRALNDVQNRPKLEAKADQLKERLKANPDDRAAAAALIDLYLVELDNPAEARKYSFLLADAELARRIKLAATPPDELTEADLAAVGDLYRDLAAKANADSRPRMTVRAYRAMAEWLDRAAPDAADRLRIELAIGDLKNQLASYDVDPRSIHRPSADNRIELTVKLLQTLTGHDGEWIGAPSFSPDGKYIATPGADATVRIFEAATGRLLQTLSEHKNYTNYARYVGDGSTLLSAGGDGKLIVWSASTNRPRAILDSGDKRIYGFDATADGRRAVTANREGQVHVWNVGSSATPVNAPSFVSAAHTAAISPDGRTIAAGGEDKYVLIANAATGKELGRLAGHWNTVRGLAFSPDGKSLASAAADGTVQLWNPATRESLGFVDRLEVGRYRIAFSPDSRLLAVSGADAFVRIYDVFYRTLAASIDTGMEETYGVAFDALGQRLVITGKNKVARLYALNRDYRKAADPVTRDLPTAYFWCQTSSVRKIDVNGVFWIMDDDEPVRQYVYAHADGNYRIRIKASAKQAGDELPKLALKFDDPERPAAATFEVKATTTALPDEFTADVTLKRGGHNLYLHFTNDYYKDESVDRNVAILSVQVVGGIDPVASPPPATTDAPAIAPVEPKSQAPAGE